VWSDPRKAILNIAASGKFSSDRTICDYRKAHGTGGPLHMGKDTHALSGPVQRTALEVLAANGVETVIHRGGGWMQSVPPGSSSRSIR